MRLSEEEMLERRKEIIEGAFKLFCDKGIEAVKLKEIGQAVNIGEATIYRYFGNKENLVLEAFIMLWDMIMDNVYKHVMENPDYDSLSGFDQIKAWIDAFCYLYLDARDYVLFSYEAKVYLVRHNVKLNRQYQDALMHVWREVCVAALDKGQKDGSIPANRSSEDLFFAIWGSVRGYVAKIVIYDKLYEEGSPWESRYHIMRDGILCALSSGWEVNK